MFCVIRIRKKIIYKYKQPFVFSLGEKRELLLSFIFYGSSGKKASLDSLQGNKTCNSQTADFA